MLYIFNKIIKKQNARLSIRLYRASVRHNEIFEISGVSQPPKSKFISQPKTGHVRLYQIRDYGSNPQSIYT